MQKLYFSLGYMKEITTVISAGKKQKILFQEKFSFTCVYESKRFSIYEQDDKIFLFHDEKNFIEPIEYLKEHYVFEKMIDVGPAEKIENIEIKQGDIIIPNTIISADTHTAFFCESFIGANYDLKKFGLLLNGILLTQSSEKNEEKLHEADIQDSYGYNFLEKYEEVFEKEKNISLIRYIPTNDKNTFFDLIAILEIMI